MENLCHTLTGWALARAGLGKLSPLATATCIVGANLPDVDVVTLLWGDLTYLEHHRGVTHALPGLAAQAVLLPLVVWAIGRRHARGHPSKPQARFWGLFVASAAGLASHFVLDWTNSYGVRPLLPYDRTWYYGDLVYIVDPWLWLLLGGALFLGGARSRVALAGWLGLFLVLAGFVVFAGTAITPEVIGRVHWFWLAALGVLFALRWARPAVAPEALARGALAGYAGYVICLLFLHHAAVRRVEAAAAPLADDGVRVLAADAIPLPMRPDLWRIFVLTPASVHVATDDLMRGMGDWTEHSRGLDQPEARAALATCPGRLAQHFSRYLTARVTPVGSTTKVELVDERFPTTRGRRPVGYIPVELGPSLAPLPDSRHCPEL